MIVLAPNLNPPYSENKESSVHRTTFGAQGFCICGLKRRTKRARNIVNYIDNIQGVDPSGCC